MRDGRDQGAGRHRRSSGRSANPGSRGTSTARSPDRVFGVLGPLGMPARIVHDTVSNPLLSGEWAPPFGGRCRPAAARSREPRHPGSRSLADSPLGALGLGAANGVFGDRLARDHPDLSLDLTIRDHGRAVALDGDGIAHCIRRGHAEAGRIRPRTMRDRAHLGMAIPGCRPRSHLWSQVRDELGYTPVYVRYNTGLHVSDNGRRLASTLEPAGCRLADRGRSDRADRALDGRAGPREAPPTTERPRAKRLDGACSPRDLPGNPTPGSAAGEGRQRRRLGVHPHP